MKTECYGSMQLLIELSERARVWIFPLAQPLEQTAEIALNHALREVITAWKAHGAAVQGGFLIAYHRFLIAAADESVTQVSGCSIDSLVRGVKDVVLRAGVEFADDSCIFYRGSNQEIIQVDRDTFRALVADGVVTPATVVFNNTVLTLSDVRHGRWECSAKDSWHARAFRFPMTAGQSALT